jgi:hypothetical protein
MHVDKIMVIHINLRGEAVEEGFIKTAELIYKNIGDECVETS